MREIANVTIGIVYKTSPHTRLAPRTNHRHTHTLTHTRNYTHARHYTMAK